jgi:hypothetical protein
MLDAMLEKNVGPAGEWPESIANYASVSVSALLPLAIAARSARWDDFVDDPRMRRLLLFLAKQYTPPDPRGAENGDLCNFNYGAAYVSPNGTHASVHLGDRDYLVQAIWQNTGKGFCANGL